MSHQCSCGLQGEFNFPNSPQALCSDCFTQKFEKKLFQHTPKYIRGHSVAVALSGGKDSSTLLHFFHKNQSRLKIPLLTAIVLEEEVPEILSVRKKVIKQLRTKYPKFSFIIRSYTDLFGYSLPSLVHNSDTKGFRFTPCAICGVLRRHGILRICLDSKIDFIVMGNTLDDEANTTILNILRGNPQKNLRDMIEYRATDKKSLPLRIKPLARFSERLIHQYSAITQLPVMNAQCPFSKRSLRFHISKFLSDIEKGDPRVLYNTISAGRQGLTQNSRIIRVQKCDTCNSYSPKHQCSACRIIHKITGKNPQQSDRTT